MNIDKITKYNYITGVYQFLIQSLQQVRMELSKSPGHVTHLANAEKIKHDIHLIEPVLQEIQSELNGDLQDLTGGEFKFIIKQAKEVSLNAKDHAETGKR